MVALAPRTLYPGHGPAVWHGVDKLSEYVEHRLQRERQVLDALAEGEASSAELVPTIYDGYPQELYPVAARSVLAHLLKLEREGRVRRAGADETDPRFALPDAAREAEVHEAEVHAVPPDGRAAGGGAATST